ERDDRGGGGREAGVRGGDGVAALHALAAAERAALRFFTTRMLWDARYPSAFPGVLPAWSGTGSSLGRPASAAPGVLPGSTFLLGGVFLMTFTSPCSVAGF